jgi:hypothetical protein
MEIYDYIGTLRRGLAGACSFSKNTDHRRSQNISMPVNVMSEIRCFSRRCHPYKITGVIGNLTERGWMWRPLP